MQKYMPKESCLKFKNRYGNSKGVSVITLISWPVRDKAVGLLCEARSGEYECRSHSTQGSHDT